MSEYGSHAHIRITNSIKKDTYIGAYAPDVTFDERIICTAWQQWWEKTWNMSALGIEWIKRQACVQKVLSYLWWGVTVLSFSSSTVQIQT